MLIEVVTLMLWLWWCVVSCHTALETCSSAQVPVCSTQYCMWWSEQWYSSVAPDIMHVLIHCWKILIWFNSWISWSIWVVTFYHTILCACFNKNFSNIQIHEDTFDGFISWALKLWMRMMKCWSCVNSCRGRMMIRWKL